MLGLNYKQESREIKRFVLCCFLIYRLLMQSPAQSSLSCYANTIIIISNQVSGLGSLQREREREIVSDIKTTEVSDVPRYSDSPDYSQVSTGLLCHHQETRPVIIP